MYCSIADFLSGCVGSSLCVRWGSWEERIDCLSSIEQDNASARHTSFKFS